jgi:hypothetical protein
MATTTVRAVPVNSQGAEVPSVTRIPSAARNVPGAVSSCAQADPAKNSSGGATTTARRPLVLV